MEQLFHAFFFLNARELPVKIIMMIRVYAKRLQWGQQNYVLTKSKR